MIGRAIMLHYSLPESEDVLFLRWKRRVHPAVPRITVVHDDRPTFKTPEELETSKSKYKGKRVIFLARDPRDVIVSSYFEKSKRGQIFGENPYESRDPGFDGSLQQFIDNPVGGFDTIISYYNIWARNRDIPAGFLLVRYEDMKQDPEAQLRRVLDFMGLNAISNDAVAQAVKFASFDNMRKMESEGRYNSGMLKPGEPSDQDSYKTRKGQVKGYVNYLSETEIKSLNRKLKNELSDYFNY